METEKQVEGHLIRRMRAIGGRAFKFVSPGCSGVPDRICVFPSGKVCFAELKGTTGKPSPQQLHRISELKKLGCTAEILYSKADVNIFVYENGGGAV